MTIPRNLSFLAQGASSTGVLSVPYGGTGVTSFTAGYIPYGNGTGALISSNQLYFSGTNMGIGTTNNNARLQVSNNGAETFEFLPAESTNVNATQFYNRSANAWVINKLNAQDHRFFITGTEQVRIHASGGVSIGNTTDPGATNLSVTGTAKATGGVLLGTSSTAMTDYQEGSFTPIIIGTTTAGTGTYTSQSGYYTKIGRQVTVNILLAWSAHTGTGNMNISGLPYTIANTNNPVGNIIAYDVALTALNILICRGTTNSTQINLLQSPVGGGAWSTVPLDTSVTAVEVTLTYFIS